ncbi:MAG: glycosyltransferase family 39 protein [Acidobacteriota bacterium]
MIAVLAATTSLLICDVALERIPHVTDEISYSFQAKILTSGRLWLTPPAGAPLGLFTVQCVILTPERWCSLYPPGWPLLLAVGWLVGQPWILGPLLLAGSVLGVWQLGRLLFDSTTGLIAAAALAASPFALLMSASSMAHGPALCATVWCLALLAQGIRGERPGRLAAAGLVGGVAFLIRPFTAVALLAPAVLAAVFWLRAVRGGTRWLKDLGWMAAGAAPAVLGFLLYNHTVFGNALRSGYSMLDPAVFGSLQGMSVSLGEALTQNLPWYVTTLNRSLWGFPWGDLMMFVPLLWPRPGRARDAVLAVCAASLILGHSFYYYHDVVYSGPRFAFEALGPLAILAARSLLTLARPLEMVLRQPRLRLAVAGLGATMLLAFPLGRRLPEQIVWHSRWYQGVSAEPLRKATQAGVGPEALVLVAGTPDAYGAFFLANDFPLDHGRVFVRDSAPLRRAALVAFHRPEIWLARVVLVVADPAHPADFASATEVSWTRLR